VYVSAEWRNIGRKRLLLKVWSQNSLGEAERRLWSRLLECRSITQIRVFQPRAGSLNFSTWTVVMCSFLKYCFEGLKFCLLHMCLLLSLRTRLRPAQRFASTSCEIVQKTQKKSYPPPLILQPEWPLGWWTRTLLLLSTEVKFK